MITWAIFVGDFICEASDINSGWWYTYPSEKYESQLG